MTKCLFCKSKNIRKFGSLIVKFADIPIKQTPNYLEIDRQRYQCKICKKTFFEDLPNIDSKRRCTNRLKDWLIQESFKQSFVNLAKQTDLNESTIRRIFEDYAKSKGVNLPARKAVLALEKLDSLKLTNESDQHGEE